VTLSPRDLGALSLQASEAIEQGLALTTIPPEALAALVSLAHDAAHQRRLADASIAALAEARDRVGVQAATIASQATEIYRLQREIAAAVEAAKT
jgi:ATP-dependent Clp protease ATP-binding subunit ClpA